MITTIDKITVNTLEEFLNAIKEGYLFKNINITFSRELLFNYFKENKDADHTCMYVYSHCFLIGYGTEIDYCESLKYAKKSADLGNAIATRLVAYIYEKGIGVEEDLNIAFEYYKKAADLGEPGANTKVADFYYYGAVVEKNTEKAIEYYEKAISLGHIFAISKLANKLYELCEYERALPLFEQAAEYGNDEGYLYAAYMLSDETILPVNYEKAVKYYQILADKKNARAMNNLAVLYENGYGVEKNLHKAFELFKEATENGGNSLEFSNLGNCYFYGRGTEKDYQKALEAFLKSHELGGEGKSYRLLYRIYNEGLGVSKDVEKASSYRDLALKSDDKNIVIEVLNDYLDEIERTVNSKGAIWTSETISRLNKIAEEASKTEGFLESYILCEVHNALYMLMAENWKEHYRLAKEHSQKVYNEGKAFANAPTVQQLYGNDFFDFNIENDYVAYDEAKFDGYTVGTTKITFVTHLSASSNNESVSYWLPRARLAYAMYLEANSVPGRKYYFEKAVSDKSQTQFEMRNVLYPNALYMLATKHIMGYETEMNESFGLTLLRAAAERYHTKSAYLYANYCHIQGKYEEAFKFYQIAMSDKYPVQVKRRESIPFSILKPGEKMTYNIYYEFGGQKTVSYAAVEEVIENYSEYDRYVQAEDRKIIAELFLNAPYKVKNPDRFYKSFKSSSLYPYLDKFTEIYKDEFKELAANTESEIIKSAVHSASDVVLNEENLKEHHIWGYLKFNVSSPIIDELTGVLAFPNAHKEKEICKIISKYFTPYTPIKITLSEVNEIIDYAKNTNEYFKCGILLLSFNCMEGLNLLTKHYMKNIDSLFRLCEIALQIYENQSIVCSFPYSFNKAMCLIKMGKCKDGNKILKNIISLKGATKFEKYTVTPYQPAVDFLNGKEVSEEYLLNIKG